MNSFHAQNDKTNGNTEFLQLYTTVVADALLEISMAIISAALLLKEHLSQKELPMSQNFVTIQHTVVLFSPSSSGNTFLNASKTA
jgi:hypothetical protein